MLKIDSILLIRHFQEKTSQKLFWNYKNQLKSENQRILLSTKTTKIMQANFSKLTDSQQQVIDKIIDDQRKRKRSLTTIANAIFWLNNGSVQWRSLDSKYPPWQTVFYHFTQFKVRGIWENSLNTVVDNVKKDEQDRILQVCWPLIVRATVARR